MGEQGLELRLGPRLRDVAERLPQGHHDRRLQRGRAAGAGVQRVPLLGVGVPGAARPRRERERGRDPDDQARERGLGARLRRHRARRADASRSRRRSDGRSRRDAPAAASASTASAVGTRCCAPLDRRGRGVPARGRRRACRRRARTTALLARCLERLGPVEPVGADDVRALTAGDREALLLAAPPAQLRRAARVRARLPEPECGEQLELELRVDDLLVAALPRRRVRAEYESGGVRVPAARRGRPRGGRRARRGTALEAGVRAVLDRCVLAGEAATTRLDALLAELDPQAEIELALACPACGEDVRRRLRRRRLHRARGRRATATRCSGRSTCSACTTTGRSRS